MGQMTPSELNSASTLQGNEYIRSLEEIGAVQGRSRKTPK